MDKAPDFGSRLQVRVQSLSVNFLSFYMTYHFWDKELSKNVSGVGFEPTPSIEDQNSHSFLIKEQGQALSLAP